MMMTTRMIGTATVMALLCGASLHAQTAAPAAPVDAVAFDPGAVNRAFSRLAEHERFVVQERLQRRGFYKGAVDGLTGPGTRDAIRQQAAAVVAAGEQVHLDTAEGARAFLSGLLPLPPEERPEGDAFFGTWDCQGGAWIYGYDGFTNGAGTDPLPYMAIQKLTPGMYAILYMDGYQTALLDVTSTTMTWFSPESGDSFDCRRVSAPPPRPGVGAAEQPQVREQIEAAPPAPPAVNAAAPSQPETKPRPTPVAPTSETIAWPFEGSWSCLSETFGSGPMAFSFGPDSVTVPAIGSTVGYADVAMIGGRETAYLVDLMDGQQAALVELEAERAILFAAGTLFDCAREAQQ